MINHNDNVYKKHEHCRAVLKYNESQKKYRMYCCDHDKWLHTLSDAEAEVYYQLLDQGVISE